MVVDAALPEQGPPDLLRKAEVGDVVAVQVADLPTAYLERELPRLPGPAATPAQEVTSSVIRSLALCSIVMTASSQLVLVHGARLLVKVNFKSSPRSLDMSNLLPIGEVARRSGVASSALRFYEQGLISSERAGSGHRRYPRPVLRRIAFIVFAQRIGLTLEEIGAELAKLPPHQAPTRHDWSRLSATWAARVDERIAELERLKVGLTECIGCGCSSLDRCHLANPGDRAAAGPGPRYWIGDRPRVNAAPRRRRLQATRPDHHEALTTTGSVSPGRRVPWPAGTRRPDRGRICPRHAGERSQDQGSPAPRAPSVSDSCRIRLTIFALLRRTTQSQTA